MKILKMFSIHVKGESEGYTVKTKTKDFPISDYPLSQTEFMYDSKTGTAHKILYPKSGISGCPARSGHGDKGVFTITHEP